MPMVANISKPPPAATHWSTTNVRHIEHFMSELVSRVPLDDMDLLATWCNSNTVRSGSICSGAECPSLIARCLSNTLQEHDVLLGYDTQYSCEIDEDKQAFICRMFPDMTKLYTNALDLCTGWALNCVTSQPDKVPPVSWLVAGFPCTDVSSLNPHAKDNREVCQSGDARTGSVFSAIIDTINRFGVQYPAFVVSQESRIRTE